MHVDLKLFLRHSPYVSTSIFNFPHKYTTFAFGGRSRECVRSDILKTSQLFSSRYIPLIQGKKDYKEIFPNLFQNRYI